MKINPFPQHIRTLGIPAPAGFPPDPEAAEKAKTRVKELGLNLYFPKAQGKPLRYLSAPDDQRAQGFNDILANPDVDAILALKGGYGCTRILDKIDWNLMKRRNLPLYGYSDLTAIHAASVKMGCRNNVYGPMLYSTFGRDTDSPEEQENYRLTMESFKNVLNNPKSYITFGQEHLKVLKEGIADAPILPACLSVLTLLVGTPHMPNLNGTILAVEDVNESAHRIDGYLTHLKNAGCLKGLKGLIFGTFVLADDENFIPDIQQEFADLVDGPVIAGLQFGHCFPALSLPVGANVMLRAEGQQIELKPSPMAAYRSLSFTHQGLVMGYRLLQPQACEPNRAYPLILFLHGAGECGTDNQAQLIHVLPKFVLPENRQDFPCFVAAPQSPAGMQWVDTPWAQTCHDLPAQPAPSLEAAHALVKELIERYPIDPRRVYLVGLSMGGYGVWDMLSRYPQDFAAAIPICGGADLACAERMVDVPIWAFHGAVDSVVPVCRSRNIVSRLRELGGNIRYTEVPDCDHNSWAPAFETPELLPWLFQQHR